MRSLIEIKRQPADVVLAGLLSDNDRESGDAGAKLLKLAGEHAVGLEDYLKLAIDTKANDGKYAGLNGFEAALAHLNLPFKNDFEHGIVMQAASETFQKYPGTRAMFPEVIDQMLRWQNRQNQIEQVSDIVASSRTIAGTEMISTVVNDDSAERSSYQIGEAARIPVRSIRTSQTSVGIFKHGSGIRTTYEFARRASLDLLTPFANRVGRELEMSKMAAATSVLVNGDGVNGAAEAVAQTAMDNYDSGNANVLQYKALVEHLVNCAKDGVPQDTIVGNYMAYIDFVFLFAPVLQQKALIEAMAEGGKLPKFDVGLPIMNGNVKFVVSSTIADGKLLTMNKGETLEELIEAGSSISEQDVNKGNQTISYYKTENTGYKLAWGDTRFLFTYAS